MSTVQKCYMLHVSSYINSCLTCFRCNWPTDDDAERRNVLPNIVFCDQRSILECLTVSVSVNVPMCERESYAVAKVSIFQLTTAVSNHSTASSVHIRPLKVPYSKKFSSAKNFVKSDRQAVRQEFIFVKRRIARFVFGRSVRFLSFVENLVRNLI